MNNEIVKPNQKAIYLLMGAAILITLLAILPKYIGTIVLPLFKALLLITVIFSYGFLFLYRFIPQIHKKKIEFPTAIGIGLIITTFFFFMACFFKLLTPTLITLFVLLPLPLLLFILKRNRDASHHMLKTVRKFFHRPIIEYPAFFLPFIYAVLPSTFYDSLVYHLGIPNLYLLHGGFTATPNFLYANTSIYYEIALIPAVSAGDLVPRLFHFLLGAIFILAAVDFAEDTFGIQKRGVYLLLLLSMPMSIFLLSTEKNDLIGAFFILLGCCFFLKKQIPLAGLFWGFSIGVKYFNLLALAIFITVFLFNERKHKRFSFKILKPFLIFALAAGAVMTPLLIKNIVYTGNPLFPFLSHVFPSEHFDDARFQVMQTDVGKIIHSPPEWLKLPYALSFQNHGFGGTTGIQFLAFLPFFLLAGVRTRIHKKGPLLWFSLLTLLVGSFFTGSTRFMFIAFVFLSMYLTLVYETEFKSVNRTLVRSLFFIIIALNVITALGNQEQLYQSHRIFSGKSGAEQYKNAMFPAYAAFDFVNCSTVPGMKAVIEGEARNYYLHIPYVASSAIDYPVLKKYLNAPGNIDTMFQSIVDRLAAENIAYIIFNLNEFNRLQREYHRLNEEEWKRMILFLKNMQPHIIFQQDGIFVFKLFN